MHSIQIDDQVFAELARRVTGFNVTPNDVLRRILDIPTASSPQPLAKSVEPLPGVPAPQTITEFIRSERFQRHHQTIDRFLVVLGWLHATHPKQFADAALGFQRGKRLYFAKSEKDILDNGENVTAKPIPQSPFWALTTLDNKSKRLVLEDILRALSYARGDINIVLAELPDSGIRRSHDRARLLRSI
jgi:negative regulator of replication initiation